MTARVIVFRPEPGATDTLARLAKAGIDAVAAPLFAARPIAWTPPDPAAFDALLLTSAAAVRHGGAALELYRQLACWCVGPATAAAAAAAGLRVSRVGDSNATTLLAEPEARERRWLWLAGERHQPLVAPEGASLTIVPVYAMAELPPPDALQAALARRAVVMLHSGEAARRVRGIVADPGLHDLVAISAAVAEAAGPGWRSIAAPTYPKDAEMVAIAAALCQKAKHE